MSLLLLERSPTLVKPLSFCVEKIARVEIKQDGSFESRARIYYVLYIWFNRKLLKIGIRKLYLNNLLVIKKKKTVFEIKRTDSGWYYVSINGFALNESLTRDYVTVCKTFTNVQEMWTSPSSDKTIVKDKI